MKLRGLAMRLSRKSLEEDFRSPIPEVVLPKISRRQMDAFYTIAMAYWQSIEEAPDRAQRRTIAQDLEKCEQLVATCKEELGKLTTTVRSHQNEKWPQASGLGRDILKEVADWQERLRGVDQEWEPSRRARKSTLSVKTKKTLELEFTIDLELLLRAEFSELRTKDSDGLVAAAMAAAKAVTKSETKNTVKLLVSLIPSKRSRARKHLKENYTDPEIPRCYPWLPKPRPQTADSTAPRALKKGRRRKSKRAGTQK
jgi:hypothetical protein